MLLSASPSPDAGYPRQRRNSTSSSLTSLNHLSDLPFITDIEMASGVGRNGRFLSNNPVNQRTPPHSPRRGSLENGNNEDGAITSPPAAVREEPATASALKSALDAKDGSSKKTKNRRVKYSKRTRIRYSINQLIRSKHFERFMCIIAVLHVAYVAVETEVWQKSSAKKERYPCTSRTWVMLVLINSIFTCIYFIEIILRLLFQGFSYFGEAGSKFNVVMACLSWMSDMFGWLACYTQNDTARDITQVAGAFRVIRGVRLLGNPMGVVIVVRGFLWSLAALAWIAVFLFIVLFTFANLATRYFQGVVHQIDNEDLVFRWGSLSSALYTLFLMLTFDGWSDIALDTKRAFPWSPLFFVIYIAATGVVLLTVVTSVMVDAYINASKAMHVSELYMAQLAKEQQAAQNIRQIIMATGSLAMFSGIPHDMHSRYGGDSRSRFGGSERGSETMLSDDDRGSRQLDSGRTGDLLLMDYLASLPGSSLGGHDSPRRPESPGTPRHGSTDDQRHVRLPPADSSKDGHQLRFADRPESRGTSSPRSPPSPSSLRSLSPERSIYKGQKSMNRLMPPIRRPRTSGSTSPASAVSRRRSASGDSGDSSLMTAVYPLVPHSEDEDSTGRPAVGAGKRAPVGRPRALSGKPRGRTFSGDSAFSHAPSLAPPPSVKSFASRMGEGRRDDVRLQLKGHTAEEILEFLTPGIRAAGISPADALEAIKLMKKYNIETASATDVAEACSWVGQDSSGRQLLVAKVENKTYMDSMQQRINELEHAAVETDKLVSKLAEMLAEKSTSSKPKAFQLRQPDVESPPSTSPRRQTLGPPQPSEGLNAA